MSRRISVKCTIWEDYYIDDDKYDDVVHGLRTGDISIDDLYEHAYDTELNYESSEMMYDSNGNPIVEAENGMNPITGGTTTSQPDPTARKSIPMGGNIPKPPADNEELII